MLRRQHGKLHPGRLRGLGPLISEGVTIAAWGRKGVWGHSILAPTRLVGVHVVVDEHAEALIDVVAQELLHGHALGR